MYDQIALYSVLVNRTVAERTAGRSATVSGREPRRSRRDRRTGRRAR